MNRKFVSSNDLAAEDKGQQKHKKSSSFSNSQFPDMSSEIKRHRKTKSSDSKKSVLANAASRKSMSFSEDVISATSPGKSTTTMTNQLSNQRMSLFAQMYNNGPQVEPFQIKRDIQTPSPIAKSNEFAQTSTPKSGQTSLSKILLLFTLMILILSGFFMTPK